jgi:hypothetical protein
MPRKGFEQAMPTNVLARDDTDTYCCFVILSDAMYFEISSSGGSTYKVNIKEHSINIRFNLDALKPFINHAHSHVLRCLQILVKILSPLQTAHVT